MDQRIKIGQFFDISWQIILHSYNFTTNSFLNIRRKFFKVFNGFRTKLYLIFHLSIIATRITPLSYEERGWGRGQRDPALKRRGFL